MIATICIIVILIIIPAGLLPITLETLFSQKDLDEMGVIYKLTSHDSNQDKRTFPLGNRKLDELTLSIIKE